MANNSQIPLQFVWTDSQGRLTQPAAYWLQNLQNGINANTNDIDNATSNPAIISLTGDVSGSGTSSIPTTLSNVLNTPGTYGAVNMIPVITVDSKGRITNIIQEPFTLSNGGGGGSGSVNPPAGSSGEIQFNSGGNFGADVNLTYTPSTATLSIENQTVSGAISFTNPTQTLNNLLPAQAGFSGEVLTTDGTHATWEPVTTILNVSGVIIGDTDCGLITDILTAAVDMGNVSNLPYNTINLGTV